MSDVKIYESSYFYDDGGQFLEDKAKEAFYDMFERFHYPLTDFLRENMWVADFGMGDFARCGMGGVFWLNRKEFSYFGHEIFLLPLQMIPEHAHHATDMAAKMESWQVRHGSIYNFGEGEPTDPLPVDLPQSQIESIQSVHCDILQPGDLAHLNRVEAWHFMMGGPEGTIVTEYATYHDGDGLRFSNPAAKM